VSSFRFGWPRLAQAAGKPFLAPYLGLQLPGLADAAPLSERAPPPPTASAASRGAAVWPPPTCPASAELRASWVLGAQSVPHGLQRPPDQPFSLTQLALLQQQRCLVAYAPQCVWVRAPATARTPTTTSQSSASASPALPCFCSSAAPGCPCCSECKSGAATGGEGCTGWQ
jgi:hypothetical protein